MQSDAVSHFASAVERARRILDADRGRLWGVDLREAGWIGAFDDRWYVSREPQQPGFDRQDGLWVGAAPAGSTIANTGIDWAGARWAMVELPLPADPVKVLLHEQWHADVQPMLFPDIHSGEMVLDGGDLLDRADGRTWLRLELAALSAGLRHRTERGRHAAAAACFRQRRYLSATAAERTRETNLDIAEGLAEYSGWRLSGGTDGDVADWVDAPPPVSWVRSFGYRTGPAYGFLLDDLVPGWRERISREPALFSLLPGADVKHAQMLAAEYGLAAIEHEELARDRKRAAHVARLRESYETGPIVRLRPGQLALTFDPNRVTQLPSGTVRGGLRWQSEDGARLTAQEGLITADWSEVHLLLSDSEVPTSGPGWVLTLPPRWSAERNRRGWLVLPGTE